VSLGVLDIGVFSEVWDEIVGWVVWGRSLLPHMTKSLLSSGSVLLGLLDVMVFPKIWHKVVLRWWCWWSERSSHNMTESSLSGLDVCLG